jgi:hypothetical protein
MRIVLYFALIFLLACCNTREENILINGRDDLWHITQMGQRRNNSYLGFYKFNSDASFDEIYFRDGAFEKIDSNTDIKNLHVWKQVNDSIFQIAYIGYRLVSLIALLYSEI